MFLPYRVAFLCNVFVKLIIHQKVLYDIFYEKVVKWCYFYLHEGYIQTGTAYLHF